MFIFRRGISQKEENVSNLTPTSSKKAFSFVSDCTDVTHSSLQSESLSVQPPILNEFLDLESFKTVQCSQNSPHNFKTCRFFHNKSDRRRAGGFYSSELCNELEHCKLGDSCSFSHSVTEQMYHQEKYKMRFCVNYPNNLRNCENSGYCSFAHNEQEILVELLHNYEHDADFFMFHYKTVWCPYDLHLHDKNFCVYAHNWQDFRRKPHLFDYDPQGCPLWKYNEVLDEYFNGCPNGLSCKFSHGWKELEFHPLCYKLSPCNAPTCNKDPTCSGFHNIVDRRVLSKAVMSKLFKIHPRNRIIAGTFKVRKETPVHNKLGLSHHGSFQSALNSIQEEDRKNKEASWSDPKKLKVFTPEHKNEFKSGKDFRRASEKVMGKSRFMEDGRSGN